MIGIDLEKPPEKKVTPPRIYTNTEANLKKSIERLSRWVLRKDVHPEQVKQARACASVLRLRIELSRVEIDRERLAFDRERFAKECEIEERLQRIEESLQADKYGNS